MADIGSSYRHQNGTLIIPNNLELDNLKNLSIRIDDFLDKQNIGYSCFRFIDITPETCSIFIISEKMISEKMITEFCDNVFKKFKEVLIYNQSADSVDIALFRFCIE